MQNTFWRSISGRVFSRTGSEGDEEDPFARMLSRLHREAALIYLGDVPPNPGGTTLFDPDLLESASYAAPICRHQHPDWLWDMSAFIHDMNEIFDGKGEMSVEKKIRRFAGAMLYCVDSSLAYYQRGQRGSLIAAEDWANHAQRLRFTLFSLGDPAMAKCEGISASAVGKIAAHARHAKNREIAEAIKAWWRENKDFHRSMDAAAECACLKFGVVFRTARNHIGVEAKKLRSACKE